MFWGGRTKREFPSLLPFQVVNSRAHTLTLRPFPVKGKWKREKVAFPNQLFQRDRLIYKFTQFTKEIVFSDLFVTLELFYHQTSQLIPLSSMVHMNHALHTLDVHFLGSTPEHIHLDGAYDLF